MKIKSSVKISILALFFSIGIFLSTVWYTSQQKNGRVAGIFTQAFPTPTLIPSATPLPTPTEIPYTVKIISYPQETTQGKTVTYTWDIEGPKNHISSTTIYYGLKSNTSQLTKNATPDDSGYTYAVKDFIKGDYLIPLRFVANEKVSLSGTIYFRGYALIDGKNYWTDEYHINVSAQPSHQIKIINFPDKLPINSNGAFTWEILGPPASTDFTAIVASKESKPGPLDESAAISSTPYKLIVNDFTHTTSNIPLRFIGNTSTSESGIYFFRAIAYINGKYLWSDEYSFKEKFSI
jgi:hypothetical protein